MTSTPSTRTRWIFAALFTLIALGSGSILAVNSSPGLRKEMRALATHTAGSTFEKTAEHGYIATGDVVELTDDGFPALANLDPALLDAVRDAAAAAEDEGEHLSVTSGWRSAAYQQWLLDQAVAKYGSADEAAKWVSTPDTSRHVSGKAIDIGPFDATLWMQGNAPRFGLCQIYSNETWHYELASAYGGDCPLLRENAAG